VPVGTDDKIYKTVLTRELDKKAHKCLFHYPRYKRIKQNKIKCRRFRSRIIMEGKRGGMKMVKGYKD